MQPEFILSYVSLALAPDIFFVAMHSLSTIGLRRLCSRSLIPCVRIDFIYSCCKRHIMAYYDPNARPQTTRIGSLVFSFRYSRALDEMPQGSQGSSRIHSEATQKPFRSHQGPPEPLAPTRAPWKRPGGTRSNQERPRATHQEPPSVNRSHQKGTQRPRKPPGGTRSHLEPLGATTRHPEAPR